MFVGFFSSPSSLQFVVDLSKKTGSVSKLDESGSDGILPAVESVGKLNHIFAVLDELQDILQDVLQGWEPPRVVVIGNQSEGGSRESS